MYDFDVGSSTTYMRQTTYNDYVGPQGPQGATGAQGFQGATGTSYWTLNNNQLYPTTLTNNVGIGTTGATGYALDVSGSIQFSNVLIPNYPGNTPGSSANAIGAYQPLSVSSAFTPGATNPATIASFIPNNGVWLVIIVADFNYSIIGSDAWFRLSLSDTTNTVDFTRVNDNFASTPNNNYINLSAVIQAPNNSTTWYVVGAWGTVTTFTVPTVRINLTRIG
jgi:hypothetical protein